MPDDPTEPEIEDSIFRTAHSVPRSPRNEPNPGEVFVEERPFSVYGFSSPRV